MTPAALAACVRDAVRRTVQSGALTVTPPAEVTVERPRAREHGDYACTVALRLAGQAGRPPREVAELIAARLRQHHGVAAVDVAGPGFLNVWLTAGALGDAVRSAVRAGDRYGCTDALAGVRTSLAGWPAFRTDGAGTVGLDQARRAAVGDTLARLLAAAGAEVTGPATDAPARRPPATPVTGGPPVRARGRQGAVTTLRDLLDAVGEDAARYALVRTPADAAVDLDVDRWARRSADNPAFAMQYAHTRLAALGRNARDLGVDLGDVDTADLSVLDHHREGDLARAVAAFPGVVATAATRRAPHRVARHLEGLVEAFHTFAEECRVLPRGDEPATAVTVARLWLCQATRTTLANGLRLLGVTAPERM